MAKKPTRKQKWIIGRLCGQLGYWSVEEALAKELNYRFPDTSGVADGVIGELQRKIEHKKRYEHVEECIRQTGFPPHLWDGRR